MEEQKIILKISKCTCDNEDSKDSYKTNFWTAFDIANQIPENCKRWMCSDESEFSWIRANIRVLAGYRSHEDMYTSYHKITPHDGDSILVQGVFPWHGLNLLTSLNASLIGDSYFVA